MGQTPGGQGVASMPLCQRTNQQQQQPTPQWQSRWGAIATDVSPGRGIIGASKDTLSASAAEQSAMSDCAAKGGANCTLQITFSNGCGTLIAGHKTFNVSSGATEAIAVQKGIGVCSKSDTGCSLYFKTCSPAVRVQ
ncbi:DUF4189 domain-containing protein [Glaciimonas soli]|uniref:DUF4189 domain-containing protein n=1 Tax=Glaciimonas soli TaxID=2590999 RepID=UPI001884F231|nr:DUF4189 domain-containing protein [Glaciimonas soli]